MGWGGQTPEVQCGQGGVLHQGPAQALHPLGGDVIVWQVARERECKRPWSSLARVMKKKTWQAKSERKPQETARPTGNEGQGKRYGKLLEVLRRETVWL